MLADAPHSPLRLPTGAILGDGFRVERYLDQTPHSVLYSLTHSILGYAAILKVNLGRGEVVARELAALAQLEHPNNISVLSAGELPAKWGSHAYLILEFGEGQPLSRILRRVRRLPGTRAAALAAQVLSALEEAHEKGIVHGDVKPSNVLVKLGQGGEIDRVKLIDYGVALGPSLDSGARRLFATVPYAAPEVAAGAAPTRLSDLYSVGALLFECVAGIPPGEARAQLPPEALALLLPGAAPVLHQLVPCSSALSELVQRALAPVPARRFSSAREFLQALLELQLHGDTEGLIDQGVTEERPPLDADTVELTAPGAPPPSEALPSRPAQGNPLALLSTSTPSIWILTGDPATDQPVVKRALARLSERYQVSVLDHEQREQRLNECHWGMESAPWVLVFGDLHALTEEPLLEESTRHAESSRLLLSTHANWDLLTSTINAYGIHEHLCLPADDEALASAVERMVRRARRLRHRYDTLRLAVRDALRDQQDLESELHPESAPADL